MEDNPWVHCAPSQFGLGLFSNCFLEKGQTICEYTGTRLNISKLRPGTHCAFHIPGTKTFVDGGGEYSNCKRCIASFANHSDTPNAALQVWPIGRRHRVMLVTLDAVLPGHELLINYNSGGETFGRLSSTTPGYSKPSYMGPYPERVVNEFEATVVPTMRRRYINGLTIHNEDGTCYKTPKIENVTKFLEDGITVCYPEMKVICLPRDIPVTSYVT